MPPNRDYRKKWYRGSWQKVRIGRAETYLCLILQLGHITAIDWMDLERYLLFKKLTCPDFY